MNEPYIGCIQYYAFNFAPYGYYMCQGQTLQITQYQALFSLLGVTYGGDGRTNFMLPDYRGRAIVGVGRNATTNTIYNKGDKGGVEATSIPLASLPQHTHFASNVPLMGSNTTGSRNTPNTNVPAQSSSSGTNLYSTTAVSPSANMGAPVSTLSTTGASAPFSVMLPYLAVTCTIAYLGLYPPRQ